MGAREAAYPSRESIRRPSLTAEELAIRCARLCDELKGEDITILDIRKLTQIADCFVLATGASGRQLKATASKIRSELKAAGVVKLGEEGEPTGGWLLLDYVDVIVHLFSREARNFYQLELLWGDAPRLEWQQEPQEGTQGT